MTLETLEPELSTDRVLVDEYTALVTDELTTVLNEGFPHASARRDAVIEMLLKNHDEVERSEVDEILSSFGGANADVALNEVVTLFVTRGVQIDVTVDVRQRDAGPAVLYTAFTDYGDGSYWIEHYPTREARLAELRQRAFNLTQNSADDAFDTADEETCRRAIDGRLAGTRGRVILIQAGRHSADESYEGQFPDQSL